MYSNVLQKFKCILYTHEDKRRTSAVHWRGAAEAVQYCSIHIFFAPPLPRRPRHPISPCRHIRHFLPLTRHSAFAHGYSLWSRISMMVCLNSTCKNQILLISDNIHRVCRQRHKMRMCLFEAQIRSFKTFFSAISRAHRDIFLKATSLAAHFRRLC